MAERRAMTVRLSVLITCKNERANIRECIAAVKGLADEIVVADSGSTDGTLQIVREIGGCRIIERDYRNSGNFKNWAIPQCSHPWVLIVDCDERITARLADEIRRVMDLDGPMDGYWIYRENHWMGHRVRHTGWGRDKVMRLFRRDLGRYNEYTDHAEVEVAGGRTGRLNAKMQHFTVWSLETYLPRMVHYTGQQAEIWKQQGRRPSMRRMFFNGVGRFLRSYILHKGFLDGSVGLQISLLTGFYSFLKQARLWELYHGQPQPDGEALHAQRQQAGEQKAA
jgi:glycosyltransferase involved in cell wall biosynthesis